MGSVSREMESLTDQWCLIIYEQLLQNFWLLCFREAVYWCRQSYWYFVAFCIVSFVYLPRGLSQCRGIRLHPWMDDSRERDHCLFSVCPQSVIEGHKWVRRRSKARLIVWLGYWGSNDACLLSLRFYKCQRVEVKANWITSFEDEVVLGVDLGNCSIVIQFEAHTISWLITVNTMTNASLVCLCHTSNGSSLQHWLTLWILPCS